MKNVRKKKKTRESTCTIIINICDRRLCIAPVLIDFCTNYLFLRGNIKEKQERKKEKNITNKQSALNTSLPPTVLLYDDLEQNERQNKKKTLFAMYIYPLKRRHVHHNNSSSQFLFLII